MTIAYLLAPIPKWVLINNDGTPAGGAKLYTYHSLNKVSPKAVFQDPGGTIPWTNPIVFDLNGTQGPFYWEVDSANLNDTYYLEAYDADGNLLWTQDNYFPPGSGGGGNTTTYIPIKNYLANNQVIDNVGSTANPIGVTNLVIAPSNHQGFTPSVLNPVIATYGIVGTDVQFNKNNTAATDQITFPLFPLGSAPLTGDVTPVNYIRYQCTNSPAGETYKNFQWPICQKVKNLSNQAMTFTLWAAVTSTPVTINIYLRQYYGSGTAATADTRTLIGSCVLSSTWTNFNIPFTVPDVSGNSIGTPGLQTDDDATYLQIEMPLGAPCDVLFIKPALYLGTISPDLEFDDYDQINSINSTPRCGDVKVSFFPANPLGWLPMNDGSIGNVGSGATTRANADTFQLYKTLWDGVIDTWAPVSGGRGATAIADFLAGKTLTMPLSLGRALAGAGAGSGLTARALGQNVGAETVTLSSANLPSTVPINTGGTGNATVSSGGGSVNVPGHIGSVYTAGSDGTTPIMQPTSFMMVYIKL